MCHRTTDIKGSVSGKTDIDDIDLSGRMKGQAGPGGIDKITIDNSRFGAEIPITPDLKLRITFTPPLNIDMNLIGSH